MNIQIKGTNLDLTEALREYVNDKVGHLEHYFQDILEARVELETSTHHKKGFFRCEINLHVPQVGVLRAETTEPDLYAAIDRTIPKLKHEIETYKGKHRTRDRRLGRDLKSIFAWRPWTRRKKG
jgi:ribosomal subunit interface protein